MTPTPKGKKSTPSWQKCEQCLAILSSKDFNNHIEYCGSPVADWPCRFIQDEILYSSLDDLELKGVPEGMREDLARDVVLLSAPACQLCRFRLGFPVIIQIDGYKTVKKAWPSHDTSNLTSVYLVKKELESNSGLPLSSDRLSVHHPDEGSIKLAEDIFYQILSEDSESEVKNLSETFYFRFKHKYLHVGITLRIPFFGRTVIVKIVKINPVLRGQLDDISYELNHLHLNDVFFSLQPFTHWYNERLLRKSSDKKIVKQFGGYPVLVSELKKRIKYTLEAEKSSSLGILIYGIHGTGKTHLARHLAESTQRDVISVQGSETESGLRSCFEEARRQAPCVLLLDNVELLGPKKGSDQERRLLFPLNSLLESVRSQPILIIATTVHPDDLDPSLRRPGKLEVEVEVGVPSPEDRLSILHCLVPEPALSPFLSRLAASSHGFVGGDLASLLDVALTEGGPPLTGDKLLAAATKVKPSVMRELHIEIPNVRWNDIGGSEEVKQCLRQAVEWPLKHPEVLKRLGIKPHSGVLLYGPPGCSKTLVAKALASESGLNFISIKGSDIFSKWVGESEKAVREVFRKARSVAPSIVFLDEVEAVTSERGETDSGVHGRVLSELLSAVDGVQPLQGVTILAATNRPDRIDSAMLRPGRFDRLIYVPLPDLNTRLQILHIEEAKRPIDDDVDLKEIAKLTEGYSGAEVVSVCNEAALAVVSELIASGADVSCRVSATVTMSHFRTALQKVTPRTPPSLLHLYEDFRSRSLR